jgi:proline dehydrogenase
VRVPNNGLTSIALGLWLAIAALMVTDHYVIAASPASNIVKTKLMDTLKSVTANVSSSVQDAVDKMISDTMDIMISDAMDKLENATIYGNSQTSNVKFEPKVPSGIDVSQIPNGSKDEDNN